MIYKTFVIVSGICLFSISSLANSSAVSIEGAICRSGLTNPVFETLKSEDRPLELRVAQLKQNLLNHGVISVGRPTAIARTLNNNPEFSDLFDEMEVQAKGQEPNLPPSDLKLVSSVLDLFDRANGGPFSDRFTRSLYHSFSVENPGAIDFFKALFWKTSSNADRWGLSLNEAFLRALPEVQSEFKNSRLSSIIYSP